MATDERKKKWKEEEKEEVSKREKGEGDAIQSLEACNFGNRVPACGKKEKDRGPMFGHRENLSISPPSCS